MKQHKKTLTAAAISTLFILVLAVMSAVIRANGQLWYFLFPMGAFIAGTAAAFLLRRIPKLAKSPVILLMILSAAGMLLGAAGAAVFPFVA